MQRPFAKPFGLAEPLLGKFRGHAFVGGVDFHGALADFDLPAVIAEHIFHEADDKVRHGPLSCDTIGTMPKRRRRAHLHIRRHETAELPGLALARVLYAAFCQLGRMSAPLSLADPLLLCGNCTMAPLACLN